ncbi:MULTISPECIES: isochorismate synthase [unclassified Bosea (in: a-proteobacteria)]|uniref:isochorismate synthase n=1 Tax=unclassified Bosea (in: a-proteobacteria) TaxID=2653178 RepID=UPI000F751839|nr:MULTISPECIES: isochorismate synthase [unclassified Bosea (in: a-proteobacteria)]AZO78045.1 isochorismate synthase [Bosea sp. Tri-49]RXT19194.1 isochorismate synthase [Bosea sp. Tri-39]RXT41466.1 isochorismate synthase [Bosea sp. Tri-54]
MLENLALQQNINFKLGALFASNGRELLSSGIHEWISVPARGGQDRGQGLHAAVEAAFGRARRAGQDNPILIGAIPFDVREASCLYVPAAYEWREQAAPEAAREHSVAPDLLDQRSLPNEDGFKRAVEHAIVNFRHSDVRKAVLSVVRELRFADTMDVGRLLAGLRAQNSQGYLFRIPLPDEGELVGVSPELLVRKQGDRIVSNPLAGSAKRQRDPEADSAAAALLERSAKDQYEHQLVVENIQAILAPHCTKLDVPRRPSLMSTAAMWHLSTRIEGVLTDPEMTALQLACIIHPTPAVCGFPTESAHKLIRYVEPFERGLFTGLVGWCDAQGNGEWAITIRCGIARHDTLRLFAGAGIVEASNPASEWEEVQAKLGTMLSACGLAA